MANQKPEDKRKNKCLYSTKQIIILDYLTHYYKLLLFYK
jgi:hypothetical protein